jgi:hypothetical protein
MKGRIMQTPNPLPSLDNIVEKLFAHARYTLTKEELEWMASWEETLTEIGRFEKTLDGIAWAVSERNDYSAVFSEKEEVSSLMYFLSHNVCNLRALALAGFNAQTVLQAMNMKPKSLNGIPTSKPEPCEPVLMEE